VRKIVITQGDWMRERKEVFPASGKEGFVFGLASIKRRLKGVAYVVERLTHKDEQYAHYSRNGCTLTEKGSNYFNELSLLAVSERLIPLHIHSHPDGVAEFSPYDDQHEKELHDWLRKNGQPFLLSVVAEEKGGMTGRVWHGGEPHKCRVQVGLCIHGKAAQNSPSALERQKVFGDTFRLGAESLSVGIVGLGGIGFPVAEQLARSGFRRFVLVDPDRAEATNLNRLQGLSKKDIGRLKVDLAERAISKAAKSMGTKSSVRVIPVDVNLLSHKQENDLRGCDLLLALTDDEYSRMTCLRYALEEGAVYMQAGMNILVGEDGSISGLLTEVTGAEAGRYCPICAGRLDPTQASIEARRYAGGEILKDALEKGYIQDVAAPSLMSLNAIAAGELVLEIQQRIAGMKEKDLIQKDHLSNKNLVCSNIEKNLELQCPICGRGTPYLQHP
jgi:hypothetical protein